MTVPCKCSSVLFISAEREATAVWGSREGPCGRTTQTGPPCKCSVYRNAHAGDSQAIQHCCGVHWPILPFLGDPGVPTSVGNLRRYSGPAGTSAKPASPGHARRLAQGRHVTVTWPIQRACIFTLRWLGRQVCTWECSWPLLPSS